jgi:Leucine-rich repeat (LRR) protein
MPFFSKFSCSGNRSELKEISVLNYSHNNLTYVPEEIILHERSLEELFLDSNRINELPRVSPKCGF